MTTVIRQARERDAPFIGWAILTAPRSQMPRGWFDITLGLDEPGGLAFTTRLARAETRSWWHYGNFAIAESDGTPAAALCAFRAGDGYPLSQAAMNEVAQQIGWSETEICAMCERSAYLLTCTRDGGEEAWAIENVATTPERRAYEQAGFRLIDERRSAEFERACGVPGLWYLGRAL